MSGTRGGGRAQLIENTREFLHGPKVLQMVVAAVGEPGNVEGYQHENGFQKLTLGTDDAAGLVLRAHFWLPTSQGDSHPSGNLHNHRWDFASRVLLGDLRIRRFATAAAGEPMFHYRYWPERGEVLESIGKTHLLPISEHAIYAGETYMETAEEIHHAEPGDSGECVTLVARGLPKADFADVYSRTARTQTSTAPISLDNSQIVARLRELHALIGGHTT